MLDKNLLVENNLNECHSYHLMLVMRVMKMFVVVVEYKNYYPRKIKMFLFDERLNHLPM
jgi:hypothetical protein